MSKEKMTTKANSDYIERSANSITRVWVVTVANMLSTVT